MELKFEIATSPSILRVYDDQVWVVPYPGLKNTPEPKGAYLAGLHAEVVTQGQLQQRASAMGLVAGGLLALAAPVQSGNQQVVLHITGPGTDIRFIPGSANRSMMLKLNEAASLINELAYARTPQPL
ncbi:hypothetical protein [Gryllotalpicola koreensis]